MRRRDCENYFAKSCSDLPVRCGPSSFLVKMELIEIQSIDGENDIRSVSSTALKYNLMLKTI